MFVCFCFKQGPGGRAAAQVAGKRRTFTSGTLNNAQRTSATSLLGPELSKVRSMDNLPTTALDLLCRRDGKTSEAYRSEKDLLLLFCILNSFLF